MALFRRGFFAPNKDVVLVEDDFLGGTNTSGQVGQNGWNFGAIAGTNTLSQSIVAEANHYGIAKLTTGSAAAGNGIAMWLGNSAITLLNLDTTIWDMFCVFQLGQTTATRFRAGFHNENASVLGSGGNFLRYDTNATYADTNFKYECRNLSTSTVVDSGIAADTNWHTLRMRSTGGTINFSLDGGVESAISTNIKSNAYPEVWLCTDTTAAKTASIDAYKLALNVSR